MKVRFLPQDITCDIQPNQSVLEVAQDNGIFIKSVCGGVPSCAECRVRILEGEYNVLPPSSNELSLIGTAHFVDRRRLSCQLRCFGDITVDLNEQVAKQSAQATGKVKTRAGHREETIESHAIKGSILAESRSMLSPQGASPAGADTNQEKPGALDRAPKGPRPPQTQQQPSRPQQQRPPQQQRSAQQRAPQQQRPPQQPRPVGESPAPATDSDQGPGQNSGLEGAAPGGERKPGARRRRGGRGRNRNGAPGGGPKSGGGGGPASGS